MADYNQIHKDLNEEFKATDAEHSKILHKKLVDQAKIISDSARVHVKDHNIFLRFYYWLVGTPVERMHKNLAREIKTLRLHIAALEDLKKDAKHNKLSVDNIIELCNNLVTQLQEDAEQAGIKKAQLEPKLTELKKTETSFVKRIGEEQDKLYAKHQAERDAKDAEANAKNAKSIPLDD